MSLIAGIAVSESDIGELVRLLRKAGFADIAARLDRRGDVEAHMVDLTIDDREAILRTLADTRTEGLTQLRAVLRAQHVWLKREGLV